MFQLSDRVIIKGGLLNTMDIETKMEILNLLEKAKTLDPNLKQFGASGHNYKLKSPIEADKVRALEKKFNFTLPEEYFWFITEVGNGGAGPSYGLFQFGNVVDDYEMGHMNQEPILDPNMTQEEYSEFMANHFKKIDEAQSRTEKEELYLQYQQGLLLIGTHGMTSDMYLVISGEHRGKVMFADPETLPRVTESNSFIDWYINWLNLTIKMFS